MGKNMKIIMVFPDGFSGIGMADPAGGVCIFEMQTGERGREEDGANAGSYPENAKA